MVSEEAYSLETGDIYGRICVFLNKAGWPVDTRRFFSLLPTLSEINIDDLTMPNGKSYTFMKSEDRDFVAQDDSFDFAIEGRVLLSDLAQFGSLIKNRLLQMEDVSRDIKVIVMSPREYFTAEG